MISARPRRVFISYAHESAPHVEAVRRLWTLLRANGIDARLDQSAADQRRDWAVWMMDQFREADYVVVVASAAYRRRADGQAGRDDGRGVQFEGAVLRELYYADRAAWTRRILPVVLPGGSTDGIPIFLGPRSNTSYAIAELSDSGIEELLRVITSRPEVVEPPLGPMPVLPPETVATGGGFSTPLDELTALTDAFGELPEFATALGRYQTILLLPPHIRGAIYEAPNARLHIISIIQACARFGPAGRKALLDILHAALPVEDPRVRKALSLVQSAALFE